MTYIPSLIVGLTFLFSSFSKIKSRQSWRDFEYSIREIGLPRWSIRVVAVSIVSLEAATPVMLAIPATNVLGLVAAGVLLVAFTCVIAYSMVTGREASCKCFGGSSRPFSAVHLVRNALLMSVILAGLLFPAPPAANLTAAEWIVTGFVSLLAAATVAVFDELASVLRPRTP